MKIKKIKNDILRIVREAALYSILTFLFFVDAQAQAPEYGSSPYSDQKYNGSNHMAWYEEPFLWIGLVLFILVITLVIARRRKKYT